MRTFKFRAWDKKEKIMVQNVQHVYDCLYRTSFGVDVDEFYSSEISNACDFSGLIGDEDVIVMQFTGLKDESGKNIYEGDILLGMQAVVVTWNGRKAKFELIPGSEDLGPRISQFKIIGNIYQNPDKIPVELSGS